VRAVLLALCLCLGQGALAQEIDRSPLPPANPRLATLVPGEATPADPAVVDAVVEATVTPDAPLPEAGLDRSLRPVARPKVLAERLASLKSASASAGLDLSGQVAEPEVDLAAVPPPSKKEERKKKREAASRKGSVCGVASIKGEEIARIKSKVTGCGVEDAVAVTSVAGVRLSQTATVDCSIARALNAWVDEVAQPAFDGRLVELQVAAHYSCRGRNNVKGAKISEHGKGRAIDISAFILSNGKVFTVARDYNKLLRRIYKAGCGYFMTTLGPGSDGYHEDHFHFDTSARKGGAYCR
jgi:hypothetical protein